MSDLYIFPVTAEVITGASCEQGDAEQRGYIDWCGRWCDEPDLWDLRQLLDTLPDPWGYPEGDGSDLPRWLTIDPGMDWWQQPLCAELAADLPDTIGVSFSVHRPRDISDASWCRVCRLLGWRPWGERGYGRAAA